MSADDHRIQRAEAKREGYDKWLESHLIRRKGENRRRLEEGHQYAEKLFATHIWLPAIGNFDYLHPEYALTDFYDKQRFVDFAYIRPPYRICFEIDGYGPHAKQVSRRTFAEGLMRQNQLVLDDWLVFRFAVDDLEQQQRRCQQMILHIIGKMYGSAPKRSEELTPREMQIYQLIVELGTVVTPSLLAEKLNITRVHVQRLLRGIHIKGYIQASNKTSKQRIRGYIPTFKPELKYR